MNVSVRPASTDDPPLDIESAKVLLQNPVIPEIVAPIIDEAGLDLRGMAARERLEIGEEVFDGLLDHFRQILARVTNLVIVQRYASFHLVANPLWRPLAGAPGHPSEPEPRQILDAYAGWEEIERVLAPNGPYPALAELLSASRENWLAASRELLLRVANHAVEIAEVIGVAPCALGRLTGVAFGVSDPHNGGRTVAILRYGAKRVVYKPRPLDPELAWNEIFGVVVESVTGAPARLPRIANFDGFGFMEFIETADCPDEAAARRGYFRYGVLMAMAHALGSVDLHHENVIVRGEHPIAIDCEPLFRARLATSDFGGSRLEIERNLSLSDFDVRESVLELGLLPIVMETPLGLDRDDGSRQVQEIDIGALCAYAAQPYKETVPCAMGTDRLHMRPYPIIARQFPNLPRVAGEPRLAKNHVEDLVAGFEAAHRRLVELASDYAGDGGWLGRQGPARVRLLARPTMDYMTVLARSLSPQALRSTEARRERIRRDLADLAINRMDGVGDLAPLETQSLLDGDIPYFSLAAGDARCGGARLHESPVEAARTRWRAMDEFDRAMQVAQIREQLLRRDQDVLHGRPNGTDCESYERQAFAIVETLAKSAVAHQGAPCWVYASYAPGVSSTMAHMDREALYEGGAGTALVLAEAGALAGREDWIDLAVGVFDPILKRGAPPKSASRGCGLGRGLGGLIYALTRIARASGRERLLDAAARLALEHGQALAERDGPNEILYGRSGLLLALVALNRSRPDFRIRALADATARLVVDDARLSGDFVYWPSSNGREMPNPSHGSSGIAMALARWAALSGDDRAGKLALQALRHDDQFWTAQENGWADGRFQGVEMAERCNWSWCNGRSGGLLARAAVAEALNGPFRCEIVDRAAEAKAGDILTDVSPGLCCGTAGAVDALFAVCRYRSHGHLAAKAQAAAARMARQSSTNHYLTLTGSLFSGTAGLAFGLLRAARPDEVESMLWFG